MSEGVSQQQATELAKSRCKCVCVCASVRASACVHVCRFASRRRHT
jgi:hypothetical protein